ncbi:MAG: leucine-rich repeat protein [Lachnospiraceae bacterium]|nr:leucine-rich repeat protein [Lachnospiraceae bacterium]
MERKIRKLLGVLLLSLAVAATQIPVAQVEADATTASDFQLDGTTLIKYSGTASEVTIPDRVEKIGEGCFENNTSLLKVTVGNNVKEIGYNAFSGCSSLHTVSIGNGVTKIGNAAFSKAVSLENVSIGSGLTELGSGVFAGCTKLGNVIFEKDSDGSASRFTCLNGAIYDTDQTTLYQYLPGRTTEAFNMLNTVEKIKDYAFWGAMNLKTVSISPSVSEISGYAFSGCRSLTQVDIPYSVKTIDMKAFSDCFSLENITIPPSVTYIHPTAFDGCYRLKINAEEGSSAADFAETFDQTSVNQSEYEDIDAYMQEQDEQAGVDNGENSASGNSSDGRTEETHVSRFGVSATLVNGASTVTQDTGTLNGKTRVLNGQAYVMLDDTASEVKGAGSDQSEPDTENGIADNTTVSDDTVISLGGKEKGGIPKYAVSGDQIVKTAYYGDTALETYDIDPSITAIGDFAFARSGLTDVSIPDSVTFIGYGAFYHCDNLSNVEIPESVIEIEPNAFEKTKWLSDWMTQGEDDFLIVGDGILLSYSGNDGVISVPDGVKTIGASVFAGHSGLTSVTLPDSVEVVCEAAFENCNNLQVINGGQNVSKIKDRAFAGCPVSGYHIPASVTEIGLGAFDFSSTSLTDEEKTVVFEGTTLPTMSYEETATRLSNVSYRVPALQGVSTAIIPSSSVMVEQTALDPANGFAGNVGVATDQGDVEILQEFQSLLESSDGESEISGSNEGIQVYNLTSNIPESSQITASLSGSSDEKFSIKLKDSNTATDILNNAFMNIYGSELPAGAVCFDASMQTEPEEIPISLLGKQPITITIPVPESVSGDNVRVLCTDGDGQLEEVSFSVSEDGELLHLEATHFSPYVIYTPENGDVVGTARISNGAAVFRSLGGGKMDTTPDTGDPIAPKWFLAAGLAFGGLAVFFSGKKKKIS